MSEAKKPDHISQEDWDDVDSPPLTAEMLARMKPVREYDPALWEIVRKSAGTGRERARRIAAGTKPDAPENKRYANTKA